nr:immunoglobulin light chain junction region [Macaca mulatta]MOX77948.1 immunoglobulin light chain junction region [Macaca mulatta]MOX78111.1 immunoglobulin light chain junction region [Macaca mulatta]MOX78408.1 immunoglobulin light chain junction region [Macaca mulatta]MOX79417.1 immunoglobulin light chain junction region [Macaca mulatta]
EYYCWLHFSGAHWVF